MTTERQKQKKEFGDFQTPDLLAHQVCSTIRRLGIHPKSVIEPTCGKGSFLQASVIAFPKCPLILGFDINPDYVQIASRIPRAKVQCEDFFKKDWSGTLDSLLEPILVIGNPPWVTNSTLSVMESANLPIKSNSQGLAGLDAITGKSNFDISEWMLTHLLKFLSGRNSVLAMLCKTSVARRVLNSAWNQDLQIESSAIYLIDATENFGVSVNACLLVCILKRGAKSKECGTYPHLEASECDSIIASNNGKPIADLTAYAKWEHLSGPSPLKWRSGVKHDCSQILELWPNGPGTFQNGLGEIVSLESTYLYPMLKSSELVKPSPKPSRFMLVTQKTVGDNTQKIEHKAPQTWKYLQDHADYLDKRASSIYRNRSRFSVFGIGAYSFAPWKVAISGFYKCLEFRGIGPVDNKPVMLDDTCYFLPCQTDEDVKIFLRLVNSSAAQEFLQSLIFWDSKRPITAQILSSLNLVALADEVGVSLPMWSDTTTDHQTTLWE